MRGGTRLIGILALAGLALGFTGQEPGAPPKSAGPKSILWSRTWTGALREAKVRNVPIYILVSIGEG